MKWCLGKGDDVTENTHIRHSVFYTVEDLKPNMKFAFSVYQCDLDVPPRHYSDHGMFFISAKVPYLCLFR